MEGLEYTLWEVNSPSLAAIGYDEKRKILVAILNYAFNQIYFYKDVPKKVWEELWNAEEKGVYFALKIKNQYKYEKDRRKDYFD